MQADRQQLLAAISALEIQRGLLGDAVTDLAQAPLRERLSLHAGADATGLAAAAPLRRAQVTVLFADIVGSTALSVRLDAEDVLQVFGLLLERAAACVHARGGRVLRYTGDGLKAGFGTQGTREDDAAQAVLAGLDILAAGREHAEWVAREHGVAGFALRVGAHTGEVALGAGFEADNTLSGDTVNIAARMEQAAPSGALRISAETYAHVRGQFEVDAQPPLSVKGVAAMLNTVLVRSAKPRHFRIAARGVEGVATRMIGRDAELGALQAAFGRLFSERRFAAVTVVADAGIGKSRLQYEFEAWSEAQPETFLLFRGRASPQTEGQVFGLLRDLLAWRWQIADDDDLAAARSKVERAIVPLFEADGGPEQAEAHAHLLGHLIGIDWRDSRHLKGILEDPKQIRNRAFHAAAQLFRRMAARDGHPIVVQLEDLHWADSESLDFLQHLADVDRDVPMLVLAFARPALFERRVGGWVGEGFHQRIELKSLSESTSVELAHELLQKLPVVPRALIELLTHHAEGNPFYMEELVKMLIDRGAIRTGAAWAVDAEQLVVTKVPSTLTGVLQARLDALPTDEKRALQQASVIGAVFWDQALAAVDAQAAQALPALERRQLAVPRADGPLEGLREYAFHHQLLQQVVYGTVLKRDRRDGHAKVARWMAALIEQGGLRTTDFVGAAAEHFELAGENDSAIEYRARAAAQALERMAHERAQAHVGRAMALLGVARPEQAEMRWRLLLTREHSLRLQARRDEQAVDIDELERCADALDDDTRRGRVELLRAYRAMRLADWAAVGTAAHRGLVFANRLGDDHLRLSLQRLEVCAEVFEGGSERSTQQALRGLAEARYLGLRDIEALMLNILSVAKSMVNDRIGAVSYDQQALIVFREMGDRVNEAVSLMNIGLHRLYLGELLSAQRDLEASVQLAQVNGDRALEAGGRACLSALALWQGHATRAADHARTAITLALAAKEPIREVYARLRLGHAELALGHMAAARQAYADAKAVAMKINQPTHHDASAGLAAVAMAVGEADVAADALRPVLDHVATGHTLHGTQQPRWIELTCHQVLALSGDPGAFDWLACAHGKLMADAEAISDPALRQCFLQNIPHHREIVAAWDCWHAARRPPPAG